MIIYMPPYLNLNFQPIIPKPIHNQNQITYQLRAPLLILFCLSIFSTDCSLEGDYPLLHLWNQFDLHPAYRGWWPGKSGRLRGSDGSPGRDLWNGPKPQEGLVLHCWIFWERGGGDRLAFQLLRGRWWWDGPCGQQPTEADSGNPKAL